MLFEDKSMVDGQKFQEKKFDTTKTPYTLIWYQPISPRWMSSTRDLFGVDQVEVRAWHQIGKELKIETNVGDMKMTVRRTPDYFVEFIRNGETMLKSKTDVTPATFTTTIDTLFYMPSTAMLHKMFCLYGKGCFNINLPSADLVETEAEQASYDGKEKEQGREECLPLAAACLASFTIPDQEMGVHAFVLTLEKQELPQGRKQGMKQEAEEIKKRMAILAKTDDRLKLILDFNKHLIILDKKVSEDWLGEGRKRLDSIKNHTELLSLEDRVTKTTEVQENIKVSSDAKKLTKELETVRAELSKLDVEIKSKCAKSNEDIKHLAEFQTGIKTFEPWVKEAKQKNIGGLNQPKSFVESCKILRNSKNLQDECEAELKTLEEAACSASRMTTHDDASKQEAAFKEGWVSVHETTKERVARMTTLVECWNKLDGHVGKLSSWVTTKDSAAPEGKSEISIEKLGSQLNTQRTMFAEKQKLVADFETMVPDMEVVLHLLLQHLQWLLQKLPQKPQLQRLQHRHLLNCKGVVSLYFILYDNP